MTRSTKILLGVLAAIVCLGSAAAALSAYFVVSFVHGRSLFDEGIAAMSRRDYETAANKFAAALGKHLPKMYRAYAFADLALSESWNGRCDDAIRDYSEALRVEPTLAFAYQNRGLLYDQSGERAKAYDDFSQAIRLDPNSSRALFERGLIDLDRRDLDQAIDDFSEAVRTDPNSVSAYTYRGLTYSYRKDFDRALANFDAAIELEPRYSVALRERGYVYLQRKEFAKAIADLTAAIRIDPRHAPTYRTRASAYLRTADYGKTIADFEQALKLQPSDESTLNNLAWLRATCPDAAFRDGKRALIEATEACTISNWKTAHDIDTLAAAYAEVGDFESALRYQEKAIATDGTEPATSEMKNRRALYEQHRAYREAARGQTDL